MDIKHETHRGPQNVLIFKTMTHFQLIQQDLSGRAGSSDKKINLKDV